jgi:putative nucleotidyltransferase with HDIG domain
MRRSGNVPHMAAQPGRPQPVLAGVIAGVLALAGVVGFAIADPSSVLEPLALTLAMCAIVAELAAARYSGALTVSAAFVAAMLAVGFVGPSAAFAIPAASYAVVWLVDRYRWRALLINIAGSATPVFAVGVAFTALDPERDSLALVAVLAVATVVTMLLNLLITVPLMAVLDGRPVLPQVRSFGALGPAFALNTALIAAAAAIYAELGLAALVFVLLTMIAFTYMARLVVVARERTREYANLSWGVLSGLIRTLDERDARAARHCAAVAAFSRDLARHVGLSTREQELAHTAGLLHDIGKFALSDRVMERGGVLEEADWRGVRRHPEIGAELLRDLGVYGPVAEIVRSHHERIDGRGYPRGLHGPDIPAIARIVAVAEVYDTLTAPDTYRTPMTSFEALNELRRVAGAQLDATYVEALAALLAGRGTDYRHADEADFDRELDIERRMNEAVAP